MPKLARGARQETRMRPFCSVRPKMASTIYKPPFGGDNSAPTHGPSAQFVHEPVPDLGPACRRAGALVSACLPVVRVILHLVGARRHYARNGSDVERGGFPTGAGHAARDCHRV